MKKFLVASAVVVALVGVGGAVSYRSAMTAAAAPGAPTVRVTVPLGATVASVGRLLEGQGIIRSALLWERVVARDSRGVQPGNYEISPADSPAKILRKLEKGDVITQKVTFPEGFTLQKIAARLKDKGLIADETEFLSLVTEQGDTLEASVPLPKNLEGYLFPDTYRLPEGADAKTIAQTMVSEFDKLVARSLADDIKASGRSLPDVLTVASLIEREAETDEDRPKIAGVIYNRLAKNMRLEIDATVQYARGQHKNRLLFTDLKIDSPYNTYRHAGLPPGPICSPGLPSIKAALHPEVHEFLFYVQGEGKGHVFAKTFAEHRANIAAVRGRHT